MYFSPNVVLVSKTCHIKTCHIKTCIIMSTHGHKCRVTSVISSDKLHMVVSLNHAPLHIQYRRYLEGGGCTDSHFHALEAQLELLALFGIDWNCFDYMASLNINYGVLL